MAEDPRIEQIRAVLANHTDPFSIYGHQGRGLERIRSIVDSATPAPGPGCYPPADGWDGVSIVDPATPREVWRISIEVRMGLSDTLRAGLFDAVADAVHNWEPADRDGWDASVSAGGGDHTAEAYADRLEAERDLLLARIDAALTNLKTADDLSADFPPTLNDWSAYNSMLIRARAALQGDQEASRG